MACQTDQQIADEVNLERSTVTKLTDDFVNFGNLAEIHKPAANHLTDFTPPIYNVWKQQEKSNGVGHFGNSEVRFQPTHSHEKAAPDEESGLAVFAAQRGLDGFWRGFWEVEVGVVHQSFGAKLCGFWLHRGQRREKGLHRLLAGIENFGDLCYFLWIFSHKTTALHSLRRFREHPAGSEKREIKRFGIESCGFHNGFFLLGLGAKIGLKSNFGAEQNRAESGQHEALVLGSG